MFYLSCFSGFRYRSLKKGLNFRTVPFLTPAAPLQSELGVIQREFNKKLRQYVVQTFCRNVDLAAKWNKKKINQKSITKNAKGAQHGKYSLCRDGCP